MSCARIGGISLDEPRPPVPIREMISISGADIGWRSILSFFGHSLAFLAFASVQARDRGIRQSHSAQPREHDKIDKKVI
jgi:hypothetical protein